MSPFRITAGPRQALGEYEAPSSTAGINNCPRTKKRLKARVPFPDVAPSSGTRRFFQNKPREKNDSTTKLRYAGRFDTLLLVDVRILSWQVKM